MTHAKHTTRTDRPALRILDANSLRHVHGRGLELYIPPKGEKQGEQQPDSPRKQLPK